MRTSPLIRATASSLFCLGLLILAGCGSSNTSSSASGAPSEPTIPTIYLADMSSLNGVGNVFQFSSQANGAASPTSILTVAPTPMILSDATVDGSGQIYAYGWNGFNTQTLTQYVAGSIGSGNILQTIGISTASGPESLTVDTFGNLYAADSTPEIRVYDTKTLTLKRTISGSLTGLSTQALTSDSSGNLYVANNLAYGAGGGQILVFSSSATGNVAPTNVITSSNFSLGIAVDSAGNIYAGQTIPWQGPGLIVEYAAGATGAATPIKTISGSVTGLSTAYVEGLARDAEGNIYVTTMGVASPYTPGVSVFAPTANGNVVPTTSFTSTAFIGPLLRIAVH